MRMLLIVTIAVLVALLLGGCKDKDKALMQEASQELWPMALDAAKGFINDPDIREQIGKGAPLADLAMAYFVPRIENGITALGASDDPAEVKLYQRLQKTDPDIAAMFLRDENGHQVGLWPRLEAWLKDLGYLDGKRLSLATLYGVAIQFKQEDLDKLLKVGPPAIVEEYLAVQASKKASERESETPSDETGIETGPAT